LKTKQKLYSVVRDSKCHSEASDSEEQKEIDARRRNIISYRVQEIDSESVDDRKTRDALFVHALCYDVLKLPIQSDDVEKMFRLGRREERKESWSDFQVKRRKECNE